MKTALVVGCFGQDGRLMTELLRAKQYRILGLGRGRFEAIDLEWSDSVDITQAAEVMSCLKNLQPDEIYYFAAQHDSSEAAAKTTLDSIKLSFSINTFGVLHFLEGIRRFAPRAKLFYASSCLIYEASTGPVQNECTVPSPVSTYGLTKLAGQHLCRQFRDDFSVFASVGILYNHESSLRPENFVSQRIIRGALDIKAGRLNVLEIGNLDAEVDWGYAPDYVDACWRMLQLPRPDDFIVATGQAHRVEDFVATAFRCLGYDWRQWVKVNPNLTSRKRNALIGDTRKLKSATEWTPSLTFERMIEVLLEKAAVAPIDNVKKVK